MAIESSVRDFDVVRIIEEYHQLWKIEESLRVLKTTMRVCKIICVNGFYCYRTSFNLSSKIIDKCDKATAQFCTGITVHFLEISL